MKMEIIYLWSFLEALKIYLMFRYILGFEINKKIYVWFVLMYPIIVLPVVAVCDSNRLFIYKAVWLFAFPIIFFKGKTSLKAVLTFAVSTLISLIDIVILNLLSYIKVKKPANYDWRNDMSIIFILLSAILCSRYKNKVNKAISSLNPGIKFGILIISFVLYLWVGVLQLIFTAGPESRISGYASFISIIVAGVLLFLLMVGIYHITRISQILAVDEYKSRMLDISRQYVDSLVEREKDLRSYKHDFNNHLMMIKSMASDNSDQEVVRYIDDIFGKYKIKNVITTGNRIADVFINKVIGEMADDDGFLSQVIGEFPKDMKIDSVDMSTLMSNIMDNALEAMQRISGTKKLLIEIKHFENMLYLDVANSAAAEDKDLISKKKEAGHGFGTGKIKDVVLKNGGAVNWEYKNGMMEVRVELPVR